MSNSEIGYCVWVLYHKLWGKVSVDGKLKSQYWWKTKLNDLINSESIHLDCPWECRPSEPAPIPFEIEFNMPNLDYETLAKAWKKINND